MVLLSYILFFSNEEELNSLRKKTNQSYVEKLQSTVSTCGGT